MQTAGATSTVSESVEWGLVICNSNRFHAAGPGPFFGNH